MSNRTSFIWDIPDKEFRQAVAESTSWSAVVRRYFRHDGNARTIKARVKEDNINTSHFLGHAWAKGTKCPEFSSPKYELTDILVKGSDYKDNQRLINRLVNAELMERECVDCGLGSSWNGKPITLQLDHINGDNRDNRIENLRILCPNCHSQTETWCGKSRFRKKAQTKPKCAEQLSNQVKLVFINTCVDCLQDISSRAKRCPSCAAIFCGHQCRVVERPSKEVFLKELNASNYLAMGRRYGVSDNAIRKWERVYAKSENL